MAGKPYGVSVAKSAQVMVFSHEMKGLSTIVVVALERAVKGGAKQAAEDGQAFCSAAINMSLDSGLNDATDGTILAGAHVVDDAGNTNLDVCHFSSATSAKAVTVGMSTIVGEKAGFSD